MSINVRTQAAAIIAQLLEDKSNLTALLDAVPVSFAQRAYLQEICFGTVRFIPRLEKILSQLLRQSSNQLPSQIHALLLIGLYELDYTQTAQYAVLNEIVACTKNKKLMRMTGLVNAVLRNYLRQREKIQQAIKNDPIAITAHPLWLIEAIERAWPSAAQEIFQANNAKAPLSLRINRLKLSRKQYLDDLEAKNWSYRIPSWHEDGVILNQAVSAAEIPGFFEGNCSVQDCSAQWAAELLDAKAGQRVLDVCAAPGGKTAHLLERVPDLAECIAVDNHAKRIERIKENLTRLNLHAQLICADAGADQLPGVEGQFDRILLDAPCSATGVIRRHPDIKLLRKAEDIPRLAEQQLTLLIANWLRLKPGGELLYVTCSILPEENDQVIGAFLNQISDAASISFFLRVGIKTTYGWQILPGQDDMDGFYYAGLRKLDHNASSILPSPSL